MAQLISAYFDSRAEAEKVQDELTRLGIVERDGAGSGGGNRQRLHDRTSPGYAEGAYSSADERGYWDADDGYRIPDADRHAYEEGVHRGGAVLTVRVDDQMCDRARDIIENSGAEDIESHASTWRGEGWKQPASAAGGASGDGRHFERDPEVITTRYRVYRVTPR